MQLDEVHPLRASVGVQDDLCHDSLLVNLSLVPRAFLDPYFLHEKFHTLSIVVI